VQRVKRTVRTVRLLARDGVLPRWLRGLTAIGLAPIPGPFDEVVLLVVLSQHQHVVRDRRADPVPPHLVGPVGLVMVVMPAAALAFGVVVLCSNLRTRLHPTFSPPFDQ